MEAKHETHNANPSTVEYELSKLDVNALRKADTVCFRVVNGKAEINAIKQARDRFTNPFYEDKWHTINAKNHYRYGQRIIDAFESVDAYEFSGIAAFVRPGDVLAVWFIPNAHNNGYVDDARTTGDDSRFSVVPGQRLHADALRLVVFRKKKEYVFNVDSSICVDNTARMVRKVGGME